MHAANPHAAMATECLDAVRLARDPVRLQQAPARELVQAAAVLAKGLVVAIEAGGLRAQKAAALDLIDNAGRAIGAELRRRRIARQRGRLMVAAGHASANNRTILARSNLWGMHHEPVRQRHEHNAYALRRHADRGKQ